MTAEVRAQEAIQYPLVQAAVYSLEPGLRAALMEAIASAIREAEQAEREACAVLALEAARAAATMRDHAGEAMAAHLATAIRTRITA